MNSISIDPTDQNLIISSRNTWAVYKVDRTSGKVLWKLGGKGGNFKMGPGTHFAFQHHVTLHPGGVLTIFDNEGGPPNEASQSRGLVLSISEKTRRATIRKQYHHRPPVLSQALGSVQELDQGHMFVGWGTSSYFTEYGRGGQVLFDGRLTPGTSSYRAFKDTWNGTPAAAPSVAVKRSGTQVQLHVSWNGATGVSHWGIVGGTDPQQLTPIGTAGVAGFETQISVPNAPRISPSRRSTDRARSSADRRRCTRSSPTIKRGLLCAGDQHLSCSLGEARPFPGSKCGLLTATFGNLGVFCTRSHCDEQRPAAELFGWET